MRQEHYLAIVYRYKDRYIAECPAFSTEGEGATADDAVAALTSETAEYVRDGGARLGDGQVILAQVEVSVQTQSPEDTPTRTQRMYTGIVWREEDTYVSICPAVGAASQGETVQEALAMVAEAASLILEDREAPSEDVHVLAESILVSIPDVARAS